MAPLVIYTWKRKQYAMYIYIYPQNIPKISPRYPQYNIIYCNYIYMIYVYIILYIYIYSIPNIIYPQDMYCSSFPILGCHHPIYPISCSDPVSVTGDMLQISPFQIWTCTLTSVAYQNGDWNMSGKNDFPETLGNNGDYSGF